MLRRCFVLDADRVTHAVGQFVNLRVRLLGGVGQLEYRLRCSVIEYLTRHGAIAIVLFRKQVYLIGRTVIRDLLTYLGSSTETRGGSLCWSIVDTADVIISPPWPFQSRESLGIGSAGTG
jgi:hypothetical protein